MTIIAMSREFGSLGTVIGTAVAEQLGYDYIYHEITSSAARDSRSAAASSRRSMSEVSADARSTSAASSVTSQVSDIITSGSSSLPALSAPVFGRVDPAAAVSPIVFNAQHSGADVNITLTTALEAGNVQGFNVFRVVGDSRVQVNDQLILARGGEGNVYTIVDSAAATATRRAVRGDAQAQYLVEVVYNDGTASRFVGPFAVDAQRDTSGRRTR